MAKTLAIHVVPDSNPINVSAMLQALAKNEEATFNSSKELVEYLQETGHNANDWVQSIATSMGILERSNGKIRLSQTGLALAQVRDDARLDLLHFLIYVGWSQKTPIQFLQSWAYREVCDHYWTMGTINLTSSYLDHLVSEVINLAQATFSQLNVGEFDEVSFSRKSIRGAHNWLEVVNPPVMEDDTFKRRSFCPPELIMMALGYVLSGEENTVGIDILLTPQKREQICKICLLDPDALDRVLDWTIPVFSTLIAPGTTAGFYGRFVRLHRLPTLGDMVR